MGRTYANLFAMAHARGLHWALLAGHLDGLPMPSGHPMPTVRSWGALLRRVLQ